MSDYKVQESDASARNMRFGIVQGRFNEMITDRLLEGAVDALRRHGAENNQIEVVVVPGAFEIPLAIKRMAASGRFDALIAIGCVIRGETPHFEYVAGECARGVSRAGYEYDIPIGFGVLTVDTIEQAIERAGTQAGNKGMEAALAAMEMVGVLQHIDPR